MNAFFKSQFSCYPLSWMFYCRTLNNKMNRLHKRCLRIIYNNNTSSFTDLLGIDNSVFVHHRNIQVLATELHEFVNGLSPIYIYICNFQLYVILEIIYCEFIYLFIPLLVTIVDVDQPLCLAILYCIFLYGVVCKFVNLITIIQFLLFE